MPLDIKLKTRRVLKHKSHLSICDKPCLGWGGLVTTHAKWKLGCAIEGTGLLRGLLGMYALDVFKTVQIPL